VALVKFNPALPTEAIRNVVDERWCATSAARCAAISICAPRS
jgi:hypothetical protein